MVLPPWGRLYHWQSPDIHQVRIPWSDFFDLESLNKNIPVMEYEDFIAGEAGVPGWTAGPARGLSPRGLWWNVARALWRGPLSFRPPHHQ